MRRLRPLVVGFLCLATSALLCAQAGRLNAGAAVCGQVVSAHYAAGTKGSPTFLNLDEPYPRQIFTILIWGSDRAKFGDPESKYGNKKVCVTGLLKDYKGVPEVVAEQPSQIEIQK